MKKIPIATLSAALLAASNVQAVIVINPSAWYDASDASTITTVTGGNVTNWADKSGNGVNLVQATDGDRPSLVTGSPTTGINGLSVLQFAGRSEDMDAIKSISATWVAVVLQYNGTPAFATALGDTTGAIYTVQYRGDQNSDRWQGAYSTNGNPNSTSGASAMLSSPAVVFSSGFNSNPFNLQIGGDRGLNGRGWDGYIAEVLYGNETLTAGEQDALEGYLAHKWGFEDSLVDGHAYKAAAPTDLTITIVPEPRAALLGAIGFLLLLRRRR